MHARLGFAALLSCSTPAAAEETPVRVTRITPASVDDADFARHRKAAHWRGLKVERVEFQDGPVAWQLWRITSRRRPNGPLWVVPHDNENAAFAAGLTAVRTWGGTFIAVDTGPEDETGAARYNRDIADDIMDRERIDPNRAFTDAYPLYVKQVLARRRPGQPVIALHTNLPGFSAELPACDTQQHGSGAGTISIRLCSDLYRPTPSRSQRWPFDDEDTVAIAPVLAANPDTPTWCEAAMRDADFNMIQERVGSSDGSLSNYAVARALPYVNFETRERGSDPDGIAAAHDRLIAMIGTAMEHCRHPAPRRVTRDGPRPKTPR